MLCVAAPQQIAFQLCTFLFLNFNLLFDLEKPTRPTGWPTTLFASVLLDETEVLGRR